MDSLWKAFDASILAHPEKFEESLQHLLPDLSGRSEIEVDLISHLVLACGDISLVHFLKISKGAIAADKAHRFNRWQNVDIKTGQIMIGQIFFNFVDELCVVRPIFI
nr:hypothetical protein [Moorena sp. SIO1F2]